MFLFKLARLERYTIIRLSSLNRKITEFLLPPHPIHCNFSRPSIYSIILRSPLFQHMMNRFQIPVRLVSSQQELLIECCYLWKGDQEGSVDQVSRNKNKHIYWLIYVRTCVTHTHTHTHTHTQSCGFPGVGTFPETQLNCQTIYTNMYYIFTEQRSRPARY